MEALSGFKEATAYSFIIQLLFRSSTFVLNAVLLRFIHKDLLGVVNVRLMLLYTSIGFLAREPFRKSCLSGSLNRNWNSVMNVIWLCPVVCLCVSAVLIPVWLYYLSAPNAELISFYSQSVLAFSVSIWLESLVEPLYILSQSFMLVKTKALIEAVQIAVRQVLSAVLIIWYPQWSLWAFSLAMLGSSTIYLLLYIGYFSRNMRALREFYKEDGEQFPFERLSQVLPSMNVKFDSELLRLVKSFWKHSLVKQLLTDGERYVMTFFDLLNFGDQGVYDLINNLGSLVARLIFAPLEESAYVFFSLTVERGVPIAQQDKERITLATKTLTAVTKATSLLGLLILTFSLPYSYVALKLYGGDLLSAGAGPSLLRWFCFYLLFLAVNGITECFAFAVMEERQIDRHQNLLAVFCLIFLLSAAFLTRFYGAVGFILANCVNMTFRIAYSINFIRGFYHGSKVFPFAKVIPPLPVFICFAACLAVSFLSEFIFCCDGFFHTAAHLCVGLVCCVAAISSVYLNEVELIDYIWRYLIQPKIRTD